MRMLVIRLTGSPLEVGVSHNYGLRVPGERRHAAEWELAAIAVDMHADCAHAAFGLVRHHRGPL